jgi:hypothetical protein
MPRYIDADEIAEYIICDDGGGMGCEMGNPNGHYLAKSIGYLVKSYKKRCATYRKNGCYFVEEGKAE